MTRQYLIVDADDTLWENNIYFERAFDEFVEYLAHTTLTPPEIRAVLDEIELANARIHGYGSLNFGRNLRQCYQHLVERDVCGRRPANRDVVCRAHSRLPDGSNRRRAATLAYLAPRHDLTLFTKGHPEEQKLKIDRSGLGAYFGHTAIVKEKDVAACRALVVGIARHASGTRLDGRQQREVRHQSRARSGIKCDLHPAPTHLDSRARRDPPHKRTPLNARALYGFEGALLARPASRFR